MACGRETKQDMARMVHPWEPVSDGNSRVLIVGTFPSPKSREAGFYYGHPQNCFWSVLADILECPAPARDAASKTAFLLQNGIALWDVLRACDIDGAADSSIRNPEPNLFRPLVEKTGIAAIFATGRKATELFNKHCQAEAGMNAVYLPSTSPANRAARARPDFMAQWRLIRLWL
jgi:hypoxanthine-DNA glycosylase